MKIYTLALKGIPTLSSKLQSTKMIVKEAVRVQKETDVTLNTILTRMQEIARTLPEYNTVRGMGGVGDTLAVKLLAGIGDIQKFHSSKSLIAYASIDAPPYQSGKYEVLNRKISKRVSPLLRKVGYETMQSVKTHKYENDPVYNFIIKKELEGKPKKVAKIAGLNKFLRDIVKYVKSK